MQQEQAVRPRITPRDFFLWASAMVALYWSVVSFIFLIFNYINFAFPNPLSPLPNPYEGGMPYEMASILVLIPVYIALGLYIRRTIARDPSRKEIWIRRWAIIFTLFVAGATVAVDVITLLTSFFAGDEITAAFALKVLTVLVVAIIGFAYFFYDLRGYWDTHRAEEHAACWALTIVMLVAIIAGFFIVGTPYAARQMRYDDQRVNDLQSIQWQVVNYWQNKETLPSSLDQLNDPISGYVAPVDPQTNASYEYKTTGALSFELCATFARVNEHPTQNYMPMAVTGTPTADSWAHAAGHTCYTRTIDPALYPPVSKTSR